MKNLTLRQQIASIVLERINDGTFLEGVWEILQDQIEEFSQVNERSQRI